MTYIGFNQLEARLRPPACAGGVSRGSKVATKCDLLLCYQLHFDFLFLCLSIHDIIQTSDRKQKITLTKRSVQVESISATIRAKQHT